MYIMVFEYAQLLASVAFPILQHPCPTLPHMTDPLIVTICQFLAESGLNIVIPQLYTPQPLRDNNSNIMSEVMKIEKSPIAIQQVCRLFLQVTWLSEMTDPQGTSILPEFLDSPELTLMYPEVPSSGRSKHYHQRNPGKCGKD
jgi:hypothetical protein